jgi:hypothetical protein
MSDSVKAAAERLIERDLANYQGPTGDDADMRAAITVASAYKRLAEILLPEIETEEDCLENGYDVNLWLTAEEINEVLELLK